MSRSGTHTKSTHRPLLAACLAALASMVSVGCGGSGGDDNPTEIAPFGWQPEFGPSPELAGIGVGAFQSRVRAAAVYDDGTGPALYLAGSFALAGGDSARGFARWDGERLTTLAQFGGGEATVVGEVRALAVFDDGRGPALYAGGDFGFSGQGFNCDHIVRWDGQVFSPLDLNNQPNLPVRALAVHDGFLFAAGAFTSIGPLSTGNAARWDGVQWLAAGSLLEDCFALAVFQDELLAASLNRLRRWDGAQWVLTGAEFDGVVLAMAVGSPLSNVPGAPSALYLGGIVASMGGVSGNRIGRWDGSFLEATDCTFSGSVDSLLARDEGGQEHALYVGGNFSGGCGLMEGSNVLRIQGGVNQSLGVGLDGTVFALREFQEAGAEDPALFAFGNFTQTPVGQPLPLAARWDGSAWSALTDGLDRDVLALAEAGGGAFFAGGRFQMGSGAALHCVGLREDGVWKPMGLGLRFEGDGNQPSPSVLALLPFDDGSGAILIAAGRFNTAGALPANSIARWNGSAWAPLGGGLQVQATSAPALVQALAAYDDGSGLALYAAGQFTAAGGQAADNVARWDGQNWSPLGAGTNSFVFALTTFDDGTGEALYAGGLFTSAGGVSANRVARWDGASWSPVGAGLTSGEVYALATFDDGTGEALYAGGSFVTSAGVAVNRIARWDGALWQPLGTGFPNIVRALAVFDEGEGPRLFAGGAFNTAGGTPAAGIARWDGAEWSPLSADSSTGVHALLPQGAGFGGRLLVGGSFFATPSGDAYLASWAPQTP